MNYAETVASRCRYGDVAARLFEGAEVLWEQSLDDYQGDAAVLARRPDGTYLHYAWDYGSCSGCDDWESRDLSDAAIEAEMRRNAATYATLDDLAAYGRGLRETGGSAGLLAAIDAEVGRVQTMCTVEEKL